MKNVFKFMNDGLSVDETKVSMLIVITLVYSIFLLVMYCIRKDISSNLVLTFQTLVTAIAGINIADAISEKFNNNN